MKERRISPRVALDIDFCMLSHLKGADLVGLIRDISPEGLCIELATGDSMEHIAVGEPVTLHDFPDYMGLSVEHVPGQIAWRHGDSCGVVFSNPLREDYAALVASRNKQLDCSFFGMTY
ncbi:MAG: PilZ domain-containing protein [Desulfovibrio sp.]|uniref:PilZ domain-containing protein n=1 Tax=Desulfovibrio sp. 7SRBS1 TaxID=3378064 RepID=UPI003B3FB7C0